MSYHLRLSLQSEITQLERILADIPEDDVIDRYAFEQRLEEAQTKLKKLPASGED